MIPHFLLLGSLPVIGFFFFVARICFASKTIEVFCQLLDHICSFKQLLDQKFCDAYQQLIFSVGFYLLFHKFVVVFKHNSGVFQTGSLDHFK